FHGFFEGDHRNRDLAYHQGTVWPWLMGHFAEGWLRLYGKSGKHFIQTLIRSFEEDALEHGLGTISEVYDGNPPHQPAGAVSFASSVAEILRIQLLLKKI
ncbi:MAG: amylo-alpha-1,6-glucosidase, partial [Bacteroidales bacterium]|nr:amylo-alpha-1,6-glucosidase [Bacteroidales bacterium]